MPASLHGNVLTSHGATLLSNKLNLILLFKSHLLHIYLAGFMLFLDVFGHIFYLVRFIYIQYVCI